MLEYLNSLDFTQTAALSASLAAVMLSYLGVYVVLRRLTFAGVTMAQLATAGAALSSCLHMPPILSSALLMVVGSCLMASPSRSRRYPGEALVGSLYAAGGTCAVLAAVFATGHEDEVSLFLTGNILGVSPGDIIFMSVSLLILMTIFTVFSKQFKLVIFDPEMAMSLGYNVTFWNMTFFLSLALAISGAIMAAGLLLVFSLLVLPPLTGLTLSRRFTPVCVISLVSALAAVYAGIRLSLSLDLPTGPTIAAVTCLFFLLAQIYRSLRG